MASEVQIVNRALRLLRVDQISSLGEGTGQANWAADTYPDARDALVAEYPWNFAMARDSLPALTDAPAWGYDYAYQLPADCLRLWSIQGEPECEVAPYKIEGRRIVTDGAAPLKILYIRKIENPGEFSPLFIEALVVKLAAEGAFRFTGSVAREQAMVELYREKVAMARRYDAQEGTPDPGPVADDWLRARL